MHFETVENQTISDITNHVKQIKLPGGDVATLTWVITRGGEYSTADRVVASKLDATWKPKGCSSSLPSQYQRGPATWADNFCFSINEKDQTTVLLGEWRKECMVYGNKTTLHGLVVGGGGNYECMGERPSYCEKGHMDVREAADRELYEEMGIPAECVLATQLVAIMDGALNDPRRHGTRFVFLRYVEMSPKASQELATVLAVPLTQLHSIVQGKTKFVNSQNQKLSMILNHDKLIQQILHLPDTQTFLTNMLLHHKNKACKDEVRMFT